MKQARGAPYFLPFVVKTYVLSIAVGNAPNSHLLHECESGAKFLERAVEWLGIENRN